MSSFNKAFGECPVCRKPVMARIVLSNEVDWDDDIDIRDNSYVNLTVKALGAKIEHDCVPSMTRR